MKIKLFIVLTLLCAQAQAKTVQVSLGPAVRPSSQATQTNDGKHCSFRPVFLVAASAVIFITYKRSF